MRDRPESLVAKVYYWFWHDICRRPEPFTWTLRRSAKAHPLPWIFIPLGIGIAWWLLVTHLWGLF